MSLLATNHRHCLLVSYTIEKRRVPGAVLTPKLRLILLLKAPDLFSSPPLDPDRGLCVLLYVLPLIRGIPVELAIVWSLETLSIPAVRHARSNMYSGLW